MSIKNNIVISTIVCSLGFSNINAGCCGIPKELELLKDILKDPKILEGVTDKAKLVEILEKKENYCDKVKGKKLKNDLKYHGFNSQKIGLLFFVYVEENNGKKTVKAAKEAPSGSSPKYLEVILLFNVSATEDNINKLNDTSDYNLEKVFKVDQSNWAD